MEDKEDSGTDGSWTQWKTLHHQTKDLSPWLTETVRVNHGKDPSEVGSILQPPEPENGRRMNNRTKYRRICAFVVIILLVLILVIVLAFALTRHSRRKPAESVPSSTSTPQPPIKQVSGIATFNDYSAQGGTVCSNAKKPTTADNVKRFAAAAGDISKDISTGLCAGSHTDMEFSYDATFCTSNGGQAPSPTYMGPACPSVNCGTCYRVDSLGSYGSLSNDTIYGSVIVEIVDACPAGNAQNYCKTEVPHDERCGSNQTNSLDIDISAYQELTRLGNGGPVAWAVGQPNLRINITLNVPCDSTIND